MALAWIRDRDDGGFADTQLAEDDGLDRAECDVDAVDGDDVVDASRDAQTAIDPGTVIGGAEATLAARAAELRGFPVVSPVSRGDLRPDDVDALGLPVQLDASPGEGDAVVHAAPRGLGHAVRRHDLDARVARPLGEVVGCGGSADKHGRRTCEPCGGLGRGEDVGQLGGHDRDREGLLDAQGEEIVDTEGGGAADRRQCVQGGPGQVGADDGTESANRGHRQGEDPRARAQSGDVRPGSLHGSTQIGAGHEDSTGRAGRPAGRGDQGGVVVLDGLIGADAGSHHPRVVLAHMP